MAVIFLSVLIQPNWGEIKFWTFNTEPILFLTRVQYYNYNMWHICYNVYTPTVHTQAHTHKKSHHKIIYLNDMKFIRLLFLTFKTMK